MGGKGGEVFRVGHRQLAFDHPPLGREQRAKPRRLVPAAPSDFAADALVGRPDGLAEPGEVGGFGAHADAEVGEAPASRAQGGAFVTNGGSPIYSARVSDPDVVRIRLGLLEADPERRPLAHIWVGEKAMDPNNYSNTGSNNWDEVIFSGGYGGTCRSGTGIIRDVTGNSFGNNWGSPYPSGVPFGMIDGSVIRNIILNRLAPSMDAASYR